MSKLSYEDTSSNLYLNVVTDIIDRDNSVSNKKKRK